MSAWWYVKVTVIYVVAYLVLAYAWDGIKALKRRQK